VVVSYSYTWRIRRRRRRKNYKAPFPKPKQEYTTNVSHLQLDCAHTPSSLSSLKHTYQSLLSAGAGLETTTTWLDTEEEILSKAPLLSRDQIRGWKAIWSSDGGWLAAAKAINAIGEFLRDSGVNFGFGGKGSFKQPLLAEGVCIGVETVDGTRYYADKVVLAAGAWSPVLVDLEEQCVSKVSETGEGGFYFSASTLNNNTLPRFCGKVSIPSKDGRQPQLQKKKRKKKKNS